MSTRTFLDELICDIVRQIGIASDFCNTFYLGTDSIEDEEEEARQRDSIKCNFYLF